MKKPENKVLPFSRKRRKNRTLLKIFQGIGLIVILMAIVSYLSPGRVVDTVEFTPDFMRVIDADTIAIGKSSIHLKGIAAPEKGHLSFDKGRKFVGILLRQSESVTCKLTAERTFNRRVGRCFFKMPNGNVIDIQKAVVAAGLARGCPRYGAGATSLMKQQFPAVFHFPVIAGAFQYTRQFDNGAHCYNCLPQS